MRGVLYVEPLSPIRPGLMVYLDPSPECRHTSPPTSLFGQHDVVGHPDAERGLLACVRFPVVADDAHCWVVQTAPIDYGFPPPHDGASARYLNYSDRELRPAPEDEQETLFVRWCAALEDEHAVWERGLDE